MSHDASFSPSGTSDISTFTIVIVIICLFMAFVETASETVLVSILGELRTLSATNAVICQQNSDLLCRVACLESQIHRGQFDRVLHVQDDSRSSQLSGPHPQTLSDRSTVVDSQRVVCADGMAQSFAAVAPIPDRSLSWICPVCHRNLANRASFKGHVRRMIKKSSRPRCRLSARCSRHQSIVSCFPGVDFDSKSLAFNQEFYDIVRPLCSERIPELQAHEDIYTWLQSKDPQASHVVLQQEVNSRSPSVDDSSYSASSSPPVSANSASVSSNSSSPGLSPGM